ncbi:MAG: ABC transporter permease [Flavonifractor plautii]
MSYAKLVRSEVLVLKDSEFIQAARVAGFSDARILFRHLLPNVISSAVVFAASDVVMCMLTGASMSFLGLGVSPPTPEWGSILNEGRNSSPSPGGPPCSPACSWPSAASASPCWGTA